ncbi:pyridoxamine 5'-phosphate oxidase [Auritidibacter sp. NML130574]|uniref:pyridoxine/pyridoxamine 5'-phosphate oxidase n=1 Tax=Auritidibacter sp. NML130574 TaxID=2170745 RepID=UPI000D727E6F|nr:pyridoxamine 5'-phosphate oxidase family protein [Auritidibacter sp. NML130574]AXR74554.1 pyridoxamine 5'-phosphate oxidase [Auritidibacter sp. NML130574]
MTDAVRGFLKSIPAMTGVAPDIDPEAFPNDPVTAFLQWLRAAVDAEVPEPHVVNLSTVDVHGVPDARPLVVKDVGERGWAFSSTKSSRKGSQLADRSAAAMTFWWPAQVRAVRIRGEVVEATRAESLQDLSSRAPQAQASVDSDDWTLWWLQPDRVEFWQGSPDRHHHRIIYTRGQQTEHGQQSQSAWARHAHRTEVS